jgi:hypothetical protein
VLNGRLSTEEEFLDLIGSFISNLISGIISLNDINQLEFIMARVLSETQESNFCI